MMPAWKLGIVQLRPLGCVGIMMGAWLKKKFPLFARLSIPTLIVGQRPVRGLCPRSTLDASGSKRITMRRGLADAVKGQTDHEFSEAKLADADRRSSRRCSRGRGAGAGDASSAADSFVKKERNQCRS
jgi:hypothetical protein